MMELKTELWGINGFDDDAFIRVDTLEEAGNHPAILPLDYWLGMAATDDRSRLQGSGVFVPAGEDIAPLLPYLDLIAVIALDFPVYTDGRSYSKAVRLKERYNFIGEVRAVGNILIDQVSNLLRSGFDRLEVTHPLTKERLKNGDFNKIPGFYQQGNGLSRKDDVKGWRQA